jgi:FkbH-like protein
VTRELFGRIEERMREGLGAISGVWPISVADFSGYAVEDYYDPDRDRLGHVPYTEAYFAALGTVVMRKLRGITAAPYKVVVLDCDNTLWGGVVGEEGVDGIALTPGYLQVQRFMVELANKGYLICLCSKNEEMDVLEVFDRRAEMILKREHLVSWRVNWEPKSANLVSLAAELNLGIDSFIFLDDNPVECAEVRAGCPEVLTLRLPVDEDMGRFLENVWPFDRPRVTAEDRERTAMYQREAERARFQKQVTTIDDFLAGLGLEVDVVEPGVDRVERVAQLTQRTNQFNFTTVRRNEAEVARLVDAGLECRAIEVRDRFGDYGLVGVLIFGARDGALEIDTFLLSCRVLGRGVEHRMMRELGELAVKRGLGVVRATVVATKKNEPARNFLKGVAATYERTLGDGVVYEIPAAEAAVIAYQPGLAEELAGEAAEGRVGRTGIEAMTAGDGASDSSQKSLRFEKIARELGEPGRVLEAMGARGRQRRPRPELAGGAVVAARDEVESALLEMWGELLRIEPIGVEDDFFELGGTSLLAVDLFVRIERRFGRRLPLTTLLEAPTVAGLAKRVAGDVTRDSLVLIREGSSDRPALFLVHDGDGETMLYRNLALLLHEEHAVYGLQPLSVVGVAIAHTRISDMASYHLERIRSVQPSGPYLVGGMCAGGVIAYEVARQLEEVGERVAMVALIDAADAAAVEKSWRHAEARMKRFSGVLGEGGGGRIEKRVLAVAGKVVKKARNFAVYTMSERYRRMLDELRMRLVRRWLDGQRELPRVLWNIPVRTVYLYAEKGYRPTGRIKADLSLFRAMSGVGNDEPYIDRYEDPLLGWTSRTSGEVRAYDVPGGHSSMLQEPHVRVLAERMQAVIDEALGHGVPDLVEVELAAPSV